MAGRGPAPKGQRARDRDTPEFVELEVTTELYGHPLPEGILPDGESWHPQTLALWDSLREFPLMAGEPALGWAFLVDTALLHHAMWTNGKWELAGELRLRVAKYAATPEDRMRLKVKIESPGKPAPAPTSSTVSSGVTDIQSRRSRLTEGA